MWGGAGCAAPTSVNVLMPYPTDPFRFDDRTGHYGSGQADLAPVSPLAAPPRETDDARPLDPMGASPREGLSEAAVERLKSPDRAEIQIDARSDTDLNTTSQAGAIQPQAASAADSNTSVDVETSEATLRDEAASPQTVLLRIQTDSRIEADTHVDAASPVSSSGTPVSMLPDAGPNAAESIGSFADMAASMDQMMTEMAARMEALSPWSRDEADDSDAGSDDAPDAFADAQDRLDDLFGSLSDRFGRDALSDSGGDGPFDAARDRLDDLAEGLNLTPPDRSDADESSDLLTPAATRLDDLKASLERSDSDDAPMASSDLGGSLLARLFDGDDAPTDAPMESRAAELFDGMGDLSVGSQALGFDPGRWDDLPDFG